MIKIKDWIFLIVISILVYNSCNADKTQNNNVVRQPAVAGMFYPENKAALEQQINTFLNNAPTVTVPGEVTAIWVPHAGYAYSGQIAANAYKQIAGIRPDIILLAGSSHTTRFPYASITDKKGYRTPLGTVLLPRNLVEKMQKKCKLIKSHPAAHIKEHSLEVQIPFIQTVLPDVPVIPLLLGQMTFDDLKTIAKKMAPLFQNQKVLLIASSDMSHFPTYNDAVQSDKIMLDAIKTMDEKKLIRADRSEMKKNIPNLSCTMCGRDALALVMMMAKKLDAKQVHMLPYANSGDISGDHSRVVGYGAALFYERQGKMESQKNTLEDIPFSDKELDKLFKVARKSIEAALKHQSPPKFDIDEHNLLIPRGVFVTLTNRGQLRGCIGHFEPDYPLWQMVQQMSIAASTQDYRFAGNPVTLKEMDNIDIKISVLSELVKVDSYKEIEAGKHGVWIKMGGRGGTYLPEVATDMGWNRTQFLESLCAQKAGLPKDAYKQGADIYIYTTQILKEK